MSATKRHARYGTALPLMAFAVCAAISAVGAYFVAKDQARDAEAAFQLSVERVVRDVNQRFGMPVYGLKGTRSAMTAHRSFDRASFRALVMSRDLPQEFPGVRGIGFIQRVPGAERNAFVTRERADGAPGFSIRQLDEKHHDDLWIITYIEPAANNVGAMGLDVGSEPRRRQAALQAVDTGLPTMTAPIVLVQDQRRSPGVLMYLPVYAEPHLERGSIAQRRDALIGLVYAPIVTAELLNDLGEVASGRVNVELLDAGTPGLPAISVFRGVARGDMPEGHSSTVGRFSTSRQLPIAGRDFSLRIDSSPQFDADVNTWPTWTVLGVGLALGAMLAWLLRLQIQRRSEAEALAAGLTVDLERLAKVARHTSNAVSIIDRDLRITWINEGFTRLSGYEPHQAIGHTHRELLDSGQIDEATAKILDEATTQGTACRVVILNRHRLGAEYWVEIDLQPIFDGEGRCTGFIEIASDITQRQVAQARLEAALREQQSLLEALNQHAIVSVADSRGRITDINEAFCKISGYARDELLGQDHRIVSSGRHVDGFWHQMWQQVTCGASWRGDVCNRRKDGSLFWVNTLIAPFIGVDGRVEKYISIRTDITAIKLAEEALARERAALANIIDGTDVGTWEWHVQTGETRFNERWAQMIGYTLDELAPTSIDTWTRHAHPEDLARSGEALQRCFSGDSPSYECEVRMRHRDGHWVWVLDRGKLFSREADGRPGWMAGTHMDISARKLAEQKLRESEQFARSILNSIMGEIAVIDVDGVIVAVNEPWARFSIDNSADGCTPAPNTGVGANYLNICRSASACNPAPERDDIAQGILDVIHGRRPRFDREYPCHSPTEKRWFSFTATPLGSAGQGAVISHIDITERMIATQAREAAEAAVARSAELLRGAIGAIDEPFALFDPDECLVYCNEQYRQMQPEMAHLVVPGVRYDTLVRAAAALPPDLREVKSDVSSWVATRLAAFRRADGLQVRHMSDGRVMRSIDRRMPDGHTVVSRVDITEIVRASEAVRAAAEAKSRFVANTSHEIRTPLNAIIGMLALLNRTGLEPRQTDYMRKAELAAKSLLALVNDILDLSKIEADKMTLEARPFEMESLLRELAVLLSTSVGDKPINVLFDVDPALPPRVVGDSLRLQQVLINLCGNAIKFTERGEVVLHVVVRHADAGSVNVEFAVRDTGIGIAQEHQARIFAGFEQAESNTTRRFGGTGLGLAISQRLVGLMGGRLQVDSAPDQGSRFHFQVEFPIVTLESAPEPASEPRRVLIVDGNAVARELLFRLAQQLGWSAQAVADGDAAWQVFDQAGTEAPDTVLIDAAVPHAGRLCRRLHARLDRETAVACLLMAADSRQLAPRRDDGSGDTAIDGFAIKPLTAAMLRESVEQARAARDPRVAQPQHLAPPRTRLPGLRVLLVEDNSNNQQIACGLLEAEGAGVALAADGLEAVERVGSAHPPFDAVLMDLQMPRMDGLAATRRIRELGHVTLPIIAMTANASESDAQACREAGMNDHVAKPFDLDHLVQVLRRHVGWPDDEAAEPARRAAATHSPEEATAAAHAGVQLTAALARLGGDRGMLTQLLERLHDDLAHWPAALRHQIDDGAFDAARRTLHTAKGLCASAGAQALADNVASVERRLARSDEPAEWVAATIDLGHAMVSARPGLTALLNAMRAATPADEPMHDGTPDLAVRLGDLKTLLVNADMAATRAMAQLKRDHAARLGRHALPLDEAINTLDFERALRHCTAAIDELAAEPQ